MSVDAPTSKDMHLYKLGFFFSRRLYIFLRICNAEATNTPIEKDTTKVTETDTPTAVPMDEPTAAVHVHVLTVVSIDGPSCILNTREENYYIYHIH